MGLTVGGGKPYIIPLPHMGPSKQTTILEELNLSYIPLSYFIFFMILAEFIFYYLLSSIFVVVNDVKMSTNEMVGAQ